jgi:hypothetical protein
MKSLGNLLFFMVSMFGKVISGMATTQNLERKNCTDARAPQAAASPLRTGASATATNPGTISIEPNSTRREAAVKTGCALFPPLPAARVGPTGPVGRTAAVNAAARVVGASETLSASPAGARNDLQRGWASFPPKDPIIRDLNHLVRLTQGGEDRLADLQRQAVLVGVRQAARLREIERLIAHFDKLLQGADPWVPFKPPVFGRELPVCCLRIGEGPDSSLWFEIDNNGVWFSLGARLGGLLRFLASRPDTDGGGDELIGFRSRAEILAYLEETGKRKYDPQFVNKLVNKLRDFLRTHDKRSLVVTSRQKGIRFMLRRGGVQYLLLDEVPVKRRVGGQRGPTFAEQVGPAASQADRLARVGLADGSGYNGISASRRG